LTRGSRKKKSRRVGSSPAPPAAGLKSRVDSNQRLIIGISVLLNLLLCLALFEPKMHTGGDNCSYIILAGSILRAGDGYSQDISPGPPKPQTQYPFGYPLLLAPVVALFGPNVLALKALSVIFSLGVVFVFSLLARRLTSSPAWAALTIAVAVNPVLVEYSHWILSEIAFQFFSILTFYLMIRAEKDNRPRSGRFFWAGVLVMAFAAHVRTVGVAFVLAGFAYLALKRSWRMLAVFTVAASLLLAPWIIRNKMVGEKEQDYVAVTFMKDPYSPGKGNIGFSDLPGRMVDNLKIYTLREMPRTVMGPAGQSTGGWVAATGAVLSLLVLLGLVRSLMHGIGLLEVYVPVYMGVLLIRPEVWSDVRFIMPLVPFFLLYLADGAAFSLGWLRAGLFNAGVIRTAALLLVALLGVIVQVRLVPDNLNMIGRYMRGERYAGYPAAWRSFFQAGDWVRENTPEQSVITVRKLRLFYIHTGRRVIGYPFTTDADSVLDRICTSDYVVVDAVSGTTYRYLIPAIQKAPERFKLVYRLDDPFTGVLEVVK